MASENRIALILEGRDYGATDTVERVGDALRTNASEVVEANKKVQKSNKKTGVTYEELKDKASNAATKIGVGVAAIAAATALAAAGVVNIAQESANAGDEIFQASRQIGLSTKFYSELSFAAKQNKVDQDQLRDAMADLAVRARDMPDDFREWGIEVRNSNGTMKDAETLVRDVADRMSTLETQTERLALADILMSDAGKALVTTLQDGSEGLDEQLESAAALGATVSDTSAIIANEFNRQLATTEGLMGNIAREAGSVFLPVLTDALVAVQGEGKKLAGEIQDNRDVLQDYARTGVVAAVRGLGFIVRGAGFVVQAVDGLRVAFNFLSVVAQEQILGLVETIELSAIPLSTLLDGMVAIGAIDTNPVKGGFEGVKETLEGMIALAQEDLDLASAGLLERQRGFDAAAAYTDRIADAISTEINATQKRLDAEKNYQREATEGVRNLVEERKAAEAESTAAAKAARKAELAAAREAKRKERELARETKRAVDQERRAREEKEREALQTTQALVGSAVSSLRSGIEGMLDKSLTLGDALLGVGKGLASAAVEAAAGWLTAQVAIEIVEALGLKAKAVDFATSKALAVSKVSAAAAVAAASAFAAYAGIPIAGPALGATAATAAAAKTFAVAAPFLAFREGGIVPGVGTGDRVLAALEPGERVLNREEVRSGEGLGGPTIIKVESPRGPPPYDTDSEKWARRVLFPMLDRRYGRS